MSKIAIVTDSNSGITQSEAKELGVYVVPMPFTINEETFYEDVNLTIDSFYDKMSTGADIKTSQPTLGAISQLWEDLLKEYDQIIHLPMSSGLSGCCQSAMMLAQEYEDRVFVVNNQRISATLRQSVLDAMELIHRGESAASIKEILEEQRFQSSIYIMVDTLQYLKKGGRITPAVAALGTLLRIKPILQIHGEKLDTFASARTTASGKSILLKALADELTEHFGDPDNRNYTLHIAHTQNEKAAYSLKEEMLKLYPGMDVYVGHLSLSIACHIGPGALGVAWCKNI